MSYRYDKSEKPREYIRRGFFMAFIPHLDFCRCKTALATEHKVGTRSGRGTRVSGDRKSTSLRSRAVPKTEIVASPLSHASCNAHTNHKVFSFGAGFDLTGPQTDQEFSYASALTDPFPWPCQLVGAGR